MELKYLNAKLLNKFAAIICEEKLKIGCDFATYFFESKTFPKVMLIF
jgi:hypothetical protein